MEQLQVGLCILVLERQQPIQHFVPINDGQQRARWRYSGGTFGEKEHAVVEGGFGAAPVGTGPEWDLHGAVSDVEGCPLAVDKDMAVGSEPLGHCCLDVGLI